MPTLYTLTPTDLDTHLDALAALLCDAVDGGASVSFVAPLSHEAAAAYWRKVRAGLADGERVVVAAFDADGTLMGSAQLALATTPNGLHRAEVQKVLVHRRFRRQGVGAALMTALEDAAHAHGRTLLVLDTEQHSAGERLYTRCGWQRAGVIPTYALDSTGQQLIATVLFYKQVG